MSTVEKAAAALQQISEQDGVDLDIIRHEISMAIESALAKAHESLNPRTLELWKSIPRKGETPTPEELIVYIDDIMKGNKII